MQRRLAIGNPRWKTLLVQLMQPRKILSLILPGSNRHKKVGAQQTGPPADPHPIFFNSRCVGAGFRNPLYISPFAFGCQVNVVSVPTKFPLPRLTSRYNFHTYSPTPPPMPDYC